MNRRDLIAAIPALAIGGIVLGKSQPEVKTGLTDKQFFDFHSKVENYKTIWADGYGYHDGIGAGPCYRDMITEEMLKHHNLMMFTMVNPIASSGKNMSIRFRLSPDVWARTDGLWYQLWYDGYKNEPR
jgi:hypothetical protein